MSQIEREVFLDEIRKAQVGLETNDDVLWELNEKYHAGLAWASRIARELPNADRWISVEERLPTEADASTNESVLAIEIHDGFAREWIWDSIALYPNTFTHWMPMPEPPKEGK